MSSLSELLTNIYKLPPEELRPGTPESERPNEMALHEQVVPALQVRRLRECGVGFRRACFIRLNRDAEMKIHITRGGSSHTLVATYGASGTKVEHTILGRETNLAPITSVQELHEYVLSVTGQVAMDTT